MIPRPPTFHGSLSDDVPDEPEITTSALASQAVGHHTHLVRDWLAAPVHERGHYTTSISLAWREVRKYGMTGSASVAAQGLMRAQRKLKVVS